MAKSPGAKTPEFRAAAPAMTIASTPRLRRSHVLADAKGGIVGIHEVVVFPGGAEPDGADAADDLEIEPARRTGLAMLRHEGEVGDDKELSVSIVGGRPSVKLSARTLQPASARKRER